MATRVPPGIDPQKVTNWLTEMVGAVPPVTFSLIGDGQSNLTYRADDAAAHSWVVRRPPLGELAQSAHDVTREHGILARLGSTGVPVPTMLALTDDPTVCDVPLVLMEHIEGIVLTSEAAVALASEGFRRAAGLSVGTTLPLIHEVDLRASGLGDIASHLPYAPRQLRRWLRQWEASKTREAPLVEELHWRLLRGAPQQRELTLVHGDYHLRNLILDPDSGTVRVILDWELSTLGDPLADLGTLLAYWPEPDDDPIFTGFAMTLAPGFPTRAELLETYSVASGRDVSDVGFWQALGYWKVAIIIEGVRRRCLDKQKSGEPWELEQIDGLLERARQTADHAGL